MGARLARLGRRFMPALAIAVAAVIAVAGCVPKTELGGQGGSSAHVYKGSGPIRVVTTVGMVADIVERVGKERVECVALMGPGVDPHLYKPTPGDISKLTDADAIFYSGLHLEGKMADILERLGGSKPTIPVADEIPHELLLHAESDTGMGSAGATGGHQHDPHVWFDVSLWMKATSAAEVALSKFDPDHAEEYRVNAARYLKELEILHQYSTKQLERIPQQRRVLVTAHDAFRYFGKAYDVEVVGLQGISTASEVSLRDVQRIVDTLVERKIKAVFVESSVPRRSIEAVVQGCKAKGHQVRVGGELFSDAMGAKGTPEGTYIGMVRHNVKTIVEALL